MSNDQIFNIDKLAEELAERMKVHLAKHAPKRWPELMSVEVAAEYMDRSPSAIRNLVAMRRLPACRIDSRLQIRRLDIDRFVEKNIA